MAALVVAGARVGLFGEWSFGLAKKVIPWRVPIVDESRYVIPVRFVYYVGDGIDRRPGRLGETLHTGELVCLEFSVGERCWATVFGVDAKGNHAVFEGSVEPHWIERDEIYSSSFHLDDTVGDEVYYCIVAHDKFSFVKDVQSSLKRRDSSDGARGPEALAGELALKRGLQQKLIYFRHADPM